MEITHHGYACFTIKTKNGTIIADPFKEVGGMKGPKTDKANIVSISSSDKGHTGGQEKDAYVLDWPGEYDKNDIIIEGIEVSNKDDSKVVAFNFMVEGINVCHLGPIDKGPTPDQLEILQNVDILIVPVGGSSVLNAKEARELVEKIDPRIVIPMMYAQDGLTSDFASRSEFMKEMGTTDSEEKSLKMNKKDLPSESMMIVGLEKN